MIYEYACVKCEIIIEESFPMGEAPSSLKCKDCQNECKRHYGKMNFVLKGGGWAGKTIKQNREQIQNNVDATKNMEERWRPTAPKLVNEKDGSPYVDE